MSGYYCPKEDLWYFAKYLLKQDSERNVSGKKGEEHENQIQLNFNQLVSNLSCLRDIIAILFEKEKLTPKEFEHIKHFHSKPITANEELLSIIARKPRDAYECFLATLKHTNQDHVYQILESENENVELQNVSDHKALICRNFTWLSEKLDCKNGIITLLYQEQVLSPREREEISCVKDCFEKNEKLLGTLSRKCTQDFQKFMNALIKTNQDHIVKRFHQQKGLPPDSSAAKVKGKHVDKRLSQDISYEQDLFQPLYLLASYSPRISFDLRDDYENLDRPTEPHSDYELIRFTSCNYKLEVPVSSPPPLPSRRPRASPPYLRFIPSPPPPPPESKTKTPTVQRFSNLAQPDIRNNTQVQKARNIKIHERFNALEIRLQTEISIKLAALSQTNTVDIKLIKGDIFNMAHQNILQELLQAKKELMRKDSEKQDELKQYSIQVKLNDALRTELYSVQNELKCQKDVNMQNDSEKRHLEEMLNKLKNEVETIRMKCNQLEDEKRLNDMNLKKIEEQLKSVESEKKRLEIEETELNSRLISVEDEFKQMRLLQEESNECKLNLAEMEKDEIMKQLVAEKETVKKLSAQLKEKELSLGVAEEETRDHKQRTDKIMQQKALEPETIKTIKREELETDKSLVKAKEDEQRDTMQKLADDEVQLVN